MQGILVLCVRVEFALMEAVSGRERQTVTSDANDTQLGLLMFLSLLAICLPVTLLTTHALALAWAPELGYAWTRWPWWTVVAVLLVADNMTR
jgi:hypothetical protein